jgi:hypothetical protein
MVEMQKMQHSIQGRRMTHLTKEQRRALMPISAAWIDEMRQIFAREDGKEPFPYFRCEENGMKVEWGKRTEYAE